MIKKILILFLLILTIFSCKNNKSHTSQITASAMSCDINNKQATYYYDEYGKNNPKINVNYSSTITKEKLSTIQKAFKVLSNIPEEYLKYAFKTYNIPINLITQKTHNELYDGLSYTNDKQSNGRTIRYPVEISYSTITILPHEFGHIVEGYLWEKYPNFVSDLTKLSNQISNEQKSWYLRTYTNSFQGTKDQETFAELFDTWYCSKASRTNLKDKIPEAYNFANKYFLPPVGDHGELFVEIKSGVTSDQELKEVIKNSEIDRQRKFDVKCNYNQRTGTIETIKDDSTRSTWTDVGTSKRNWIQAKYYCESLRLNGLRFRLPFFEELVKFYDHSCFRTENPLWTESMPRDDRSSIYIYLQNPNFSHDFKLVSKDNNFSFLCISSD